ncbi:MAG: hypothetical protein Q7S09_05310 [bacterium]|nr:hypothetical protein [bacterium]
MSDETLIQNIAGLQIQDIYNIFDALSQWALVFGVVGAVISLMFSAHMLLRSAGNEERVKKGKQALTWTVIALALIVISRGIIILIGNFF